MTWLVGLLLIGVGALLAYWVVRGQANRLWGDVSHPAKAS